MGATNHFGARLSLIPTDRAGYPPRKKAKR